MKDYTLRFGEEDGDFDDSGNWGGDDDNKDDEEPEGD